MNQARTANPAAAREPLIQELLRLRKAALAATPSPTPLPAVAELRRILRDVADRLEALGLSLN